MRPGTFDGPPERRWTTVRVLLVFALLGCACSERASCLPRQGGTGDLRYPATRFQDPRAPFQQSTDDVSPRPLVLDAPAPGPRPASPPSPADGLVPLLERLGAKDAVRVAARLASEELVVLPAQSDETIEAAYARLIPSLPAGSASLLVTTDAFLHLYASWQRHLVRRAEVVQLVPLLGSLFEGLVKVSVGQARILPGSLSEAAWRNAIFLSVAARLVNPRFEMPPAIASEVSDLVEGIVAANGRAPNPVIARAEGCDDPCSGCGACIDYRDFEVPPLYQATPDLRGLRRAIEWVRSVGFRLDTPAGLVQSILLADALKRLNITFDVDGNIPGMEAWRRVFRLEAYLDGDGGGPTLQDVDEALRASFEPGLLLSRFRRPDRRTRASIEQVQERLLARYSAADLTLRFLPPPARGAGVVLPVLSAPRVGPDPRSEAFAGLKARCGVLEGECEVVTEEVAACVCSGTDDRSPYGLCRRLPRAIDFAAAAGSTVAQDALQADRRWCGFDKEYENYRYQLGVESSRANLRESGGAIASVLGNLFPGEPADPRTDSAPGHAASLRHLAACLGSLAHLGSAGTPLATTAWEVPTDLDVVVEPEPEFFRSISSWNGVLRNELAALHVLGTTELDAMGPLLLGLASAAQRARDGEPLETWERDAVRGALTTLSAAGLAEAAGDSSGLLTTGVRARKILGTDPQTATSLALETRRTDWIVRLLPSPVGAVRPAIGPVLSPFEHPIEAAGAAPDPDALLSRPALLQHLYPGAP